MLWNIRHATFRSHSFVTFSVKCYQITTHHGGCLSLSGPEVIPRRAVPTSRGAVTKPAQPAIWGRATRPYRTLGHAHITAPGPADPRTHPAARAPLSRAPSPPRPARQ